MDWWRRAEQERPDGVIGKQASHGEVMATAAAEGVAVLGIRAVQAGCLTDALDRVTDGLDLSDFDLATPVRALAKEQGVSTAALAHRYASSMPHVGTVVLGVKNRAELEECVKAVSLAMPPAEMAVVDEAVKAGQAARLGAPAVLSKL